MHHYLLWHYTTAFGELWHIFKNFIWFVVHFFSLPELLRTFFSPWKRMTEDRGERFNFEDLASYVIINLFSRLVGMLMRGTIILAGLVTLCVLILGALLVYLFWIFAPACLVASLYYGFLFLFV